VRELFRPAFSLLTTLMLLGRAGACDIPMFRYALENWAPDTYEAYVFYRGRLSGEERRALEYLRAQSVEGKGRANIVVREVDLSSSPSGEVLKVWREEGASLPRVVVKYPPPSGIPGKAWSGPLSLGAMRRLLTSPARERIADLIIGGSTAVWVLIDGLSREGSEEAARRLKRLLRKAEETLRIQFLDPVTGEFSEEPPEFPLVRVSRGDPREEAFLRLVLNTEPGLEKVSEPVAFPVFGRGRALCLFVGSEIDEENVMDACQFLCSWCSCVVKAQNPGVDLLMSVEWDEGLRRETKGAYGELEPEAPPPPEPKVKGGKAEVGSSPAAKPRKSKVKKGTAPARPLSPSKLKEMAGNPSPPPAGREEPPFGGRETQDRPVGRNLALTALALLLGAAIVSGVLLLRRQER